MITSYLEINKENIRFNIKMIKQKIGNKDLMPVIKANAYGTGVEGILEIFKQENIDKVAVATVYEALKLRKLGWNNKILILNQILAKDNDDIENIIKEDLTVGISDIEVLNQINKIAKKENRKIKVHVEIDTGMGRCGLDCENFLTFFDKANECKNIEIEGIYTHFSSADEEDRTYTDNQIEKFENVVTKLQEKGFNFKYVHAQASAGIIGFNIKMCNIVRPGIILYGYPPSKYLKSKIELKPAIRYISHIVFLKDIKKGTAISYNRKYIAKESRRIATIPLGYADGIRRNLSNNGNVKIRGKKVPIVGNICMDNFMVDVTEIENVNVGDEVVIFEDYDIEDLADRCNTITYELICDISQRVKKIYI